MNKNSRGGEALTPGNVVVVGTEARKGITILSIAVARWRERRW